MSRALDILNEMFLETAAPVEAPPKPTTKPHVRPETPTPGRPSPWRRKDIKPGHEPRPKACYGLDTTYSEAMEFLRINKLGKFSE